MIFFADNIVSSFYIKGKCKKLYGRTAAGCPPMWFMWLWVKETLSGTGLPAPPDGGDYRAADLGFAGIGPILQIKKPRSDSSAPCTADKWVSMIPEKLRHFFLFGSATARQVYALFVRAYAMGNHLLANSFLYFVKSYTPLEAHHRRSITG